MEFAIKQIGIRLKLSGAQWHPENVPPMLQLRCAYLNGQLAIDVFAKMGCSPKDKGRGMFMFILLETNANI